MAKYTDVLIVNCPVISQWRWHRPFLGERYGFPYNKSPGQRTLNPVSWKRTNVCNSG